MKNNYLFFLLLFLIVFSCKKNNSSQLFKIEGIQLPITDSIVSNKNIDAFIKPYEDYVNKNLDSIISYSKNTYTKKQGLYNTAVGNLMADIVYQQANPVFKKRTGKTIDMVLLNYGGIRAPIPKGNITIKTAYAIMPFENNIVVAALKGKQINSLINYLTRVKKAHPISKLQLVVDKDFKTKTATINKKIIDEKKTYYVATSDYLFNGGDNMLFFKESDTLHKTDYKIRNAIIDYFKKTDTIAPVIDDRFIQIN